MDDPYSDGNSEFRPDTDWQLACSQPLTNRSTRRSDWSTIATFYPALHKPSTSFAQLNPGPTILLFAVTQLVDQSQLPPPTVLENTTFSLATSDGQVLPGERARCVVPGRSAARSGATDTRLRARTRRAAGRPAVFLRSRGAAGGLSPVYDFHPEVTITPNTARSLNVSVRGVPSGLILKAQLFPANAPASPSIALRLASAAYQGSFTLSQAALEGDVQVWVEESEPRREMMVDYALGGGPAHKLSDDAPALAPDSGFLLFGRKLVLPEGRCWWFRGPRTCQHHRQGTPSRVAGIG